MAPILSLEFAVGSMWSNHVHRVLLEVLIEAIAVIGPIPNQVLGLRTTLTETVLAAIRVKDRRLAARYRLVMRHWEHKKVVVAVAHTILLIIYHLLKDYIWDMELGATYLEPRDREHATRGHLKQLERLGHRVILDLVA